MDHLRNAQECVDEARLLTDALCMAAADIPKDQAEALRALANIVSGRLAEAGDYLDAVAGGRRLTPTGTARNPD
jgi:hypothetical protein